MIKTEFVNDEDIIQEYGTSEEIEDVGMLYLGFSRATVPKWAESFFINRIRTDNVFTANARAVLLVRISVGESTRTFALTMGYGKNMLKDDVYEEQFGLKVILNTIKPDSLRRISKINIGGNQKLSNEQLPLKSDINDFGLDINRDLVSHITGISDDEEYATGTLSGGDILSVTAEVDITNIVTFLTKTYQKYSLERYKSNFGWIDQIQDIKDSRLIERLNETMIEMINARSSNIWMAVPEIIDWTAIKGFKYHGREILDDIYIDKVKESFREPLTNIEQLKSKRIIAISNVDDSIQHNWGSHRCIYGELTLDGQAYCINNGKWFRINNDFVAQVNSDYNQTIVSDLTFNDFTTEHNSENAYSIDFQSKNPSQYIVMDGENLTYGGGHSKIELCDLLSKDKYLIHIKPYSGSSTLSHLFNQAAVSAELILSDSQFLALANQKIAELSDDDDFQITDRRVIKVVFGIISKVDTPLPHIPFFSRVSFRHARHRLQAFGFEVSIKTIRDVRKV